MGFQIGDQVEICSEEEGFLGSYFAAKIMGQVGNKSNKKTMYVVQYETLLKDDESGPLVEVVPASEVRSRPPPETNTPVTGFKLYEEVDAFDKDGWWVGKVTGRDGSDKYLVYFDIWKVEAAYPLAQLRVHQEWFNGKWFNGKWFSSKKKFTKS